MKLRLFFQYLLETLNVYLRNIFPIIFTTFCLGALFIGVTLCFMVVGIYLLQIISPGSISSDYVISLSATTPLTAAIAFIAFFLAILLYWCTLIFFHSILSIYAFYITFRSEDEDYHLFLSMLKERIWKVFMASFSASTRIALGAICLIIPGIVLSLRYFAINYFVMVENAGFHEAKSKSTAVVFGFKLILFLFFTVINIVNSFTFDSNLYEESMLKIAIEIFIYILISCYDLILIYTICRHEAHKDIVAPIVEGSISPQSQPQSQ